ncbi:MAG: PAS domain-containing sensor histidine kinase [Bacteroidetes bacterium]|nr:PAS domain-containing sensor histidine kinase [Bacteroidota bacterium]
MVSMQPSEHQPLANRRASQEVLYRQIQFFSEHWQLAAFANSVPDYILVLNRYHQTVFCNNKLIKFLGIDSSRAVLGEQPDEFMQSPGAAMPFYETFTYEEDHFLNKNSSPNFYAEHESTAQEYRISTNGTNSPAELRISSVPMTVNAEQFTIFILTDISNEKRRLALEKIFFHDLLNSVGSLLAYAKLLKDATPEEAGQFREMIYTIALQLADEITAQRQLTAAENHEIHIDPTVIHSRTMLHAVCESFKMHQEGKDKFIEVDSSSDDFMCITDEVLLRRVLGNLTKNALEASPQRATVTLGCINNETTIDFWVHNNSVIPLEVQKQIFQRSFSTKGTGRGLGTYSVKLLTEHYLHGAIDFESSPRTGTMFTVSLPKNIRKHARQKKNIITFSPSRA